MGARGLFFFFNDTATTEIYTLSLHDALPISCAGDDGCEGAGVAGWALAAGAVKAEGDDDGVTGARAGCAAPAAGSGDETGETALVEDQGAGAAGEGCGAAAGGGLFAAEGCALRDVQSDGVTGGMGGVGNNGPAWAAGFSGADVVAGGEDRKSTRLNSSHGYISYAVFCLKKKKSRPVRRLSVGLLG